MEFAILFITILFVSLFQVAVPFIVKRTVVFGVTIPYEQAKHPKVMSFKRLYAFFTFIVAVAVIIGFFIYNQDPKVDETRLVLTGVILPFVIILTSLSLYFYFHFKMIKLKQSQEWYGEIKQVHYTDLALRSKDEMLASFVHFIPTVITVAIVLLSVNLYDQLPSQIPTHWGADGQPDAFSDKSWMSVLSLPIILFITQLMFFGINMFTKRSGIKINAGNVTSSKLRQLRLRKYTSWFLFVINILMTLLFAFFQLNLLYGNLFSDSLMMLVPIIFLVLVLGGTLGLAVKVGKVDSDFEGKLVIDKSNKIEGIDEDQYWIGGLIYFNRNDSSIFVEKRFGLGWTMNFANPLGYFIIIVPVVLILILS